MAELKPCPFCGGIGVIKIDDFGGAMKFLPHCSNYGESCWGMQENWFNSLEEAIDAWNRRAEDGK